MPPCTLPSGVEQMSPSQWMIGCGPEAAEAGGSDGAGTAGGGGGEGGMRTICAGTARRVSFAGTAAPVDGDG